MISQKGRVKLVVHCQAASPGHVLTTDTAGSEFETHSGIPLAYYCFGGFLEGEKLDLFLRECVGADVVILDAWTHPEGDPNAIPDPHDKMLAIARTIQKRNPSAAILALLMDNHEVDVHAIAQPTDEYLGEPVITALRLAWVRRAEPDVPLVLVVDDLPWNLQAARKQLTERYFVITCQSYLQAMKLMDKLNFAVVMTDLLMPAEAAGQSRESREKLVGQAMAVGSFVAAKALEKGIGLIFVVSDTGHHDHPIGHVAEMLGTTGRICWRCGNNCPKTEGVKDWARVLEIAP